MANSTFVSANITANNITTIYINATAALMLGGISTLQRNSLLPGNGTIIYNTDTGAIEVYRNGTWGGIITTAAPNVALIAAANLADLPNTALARANLGLGGAATHAVGDFLATGSNLGDVASVPTARTNLGLGTAATHVAGDFLATSNNLADVISQAAARANLGIGTAGQHASGDFLSTIANLGDLASQTTARTNLGLGTAATHATSEYLSTANDLSDVANATTARANLGLGTCCTLGAAAILAVSNNLSDLASATTARTNLGIGTAATHSSGDFLLATNNLSDTGSQVTARTNLGLGTMAVQNASAVAIAGGSSSCSAYTATASSDQIVLTPSSGNPSSHSLPLSMLAVPSGNITATIGDFLNTSGATGFTAANVVIAPSVGTARNIGAVTQLVNNTTAVTSNTPFTIITMAAAVPPSTTSSFTFNNTYITNASAPAQVLIVFSINTSSPSAPDQPTITYNITGAGACTITVNNGSLSALSAAPQIIVIAL